MKPTSQTYAELQEARAKCNDLEMALARSAEIHAELSDAQHLAEVRLLQQSRRTSTLVQQNESQREQITEMAAAIADLEDSLQRIQRVFEDSRNRTEALLSASLEDDLLDSPPHTPRNVPGNTLFDGIAEYFALIEGAYRRQASALHRARRRAAEAEAAMQSGNAADGLEALRREHRRTVAQHALDIASLHKENAALRLRAQQAERNLAATQRRTEHETNFAMRLMSEAEQTASQATREVDELRSSAKAAVQRTRRDSMAMVTQLDDDSKRLYGDLTKTRQQLLEAEEDMARQQSEHDRVLAAEVARADALERELVEQKRMTRRETERANEAIVAAIEAVDSINERSPENTLRGSGNALRWLDSSSSSTAASPSSQKRGSRILSSPRHRNGVTALPRTSTYRAFKKLLQEMQDGNAAAVFDRRLLRHRSIDMLGVPAVQTGAASPMTVVMLRMWLQGVAHGIEPDALQAAFATLVAWTESQCSARSVATVEAHSRLTTRIAGLTTALWQFFYGTGGRCETWCQTSQPDVAGYASVVEKLRTPLSRAADTSLVAMLGCAQARMASHVDEMSDWNPSAKTKAPPSDVVCVITETSKNMRSWGVAPPVAVECERWIIGWAVAGLFNAVIMDSRFCTIEAVLKIRVAFVALDRPRQMQCRSKWVMEAIAPLRNLLSLIETASTQTGWTCEISDIMEWASAIAPSLNRPQVYRVLNTVASNTEFEHSNVIRKILRTVSAKDTTPNNSDSIFCRQPSTMPTVACAEWGQGTQEQFDRVAESVLKVQFENNVTSILKRE